jgi:predicted anti-sigma-YlaC factor YlaD
MPSPIETQRCQEIFAMLSDYLNLELPAETCAEIENHLKGCAPCIEFTESLKKTVELCRNYRPAELPQPAAAEAREELLRAYQGMMARKKSERG